MNFLRIVAKLLAILIIESLVLAGIVILANMFFFYPERPFELIGLAIMPLFFLMYKLVLELWLLLALFKPQVVEEKMSTKSFLKSRGFGVLFVTVILIFLALDLPTSEIFYMHVLPILYPLSVLMAFPLYRKTLIGDWFEPEHAK